MLFFRVFQLQIVNILLLLEISLPASFTVCPSISSNFYATEGKKSVLIRSCPGPYFPAFGLNTERYSVRMRENTDLENSYKGHFSRSDRLFCEFFISAEFGRLSETVYGTMRLEIRKYNNFESMKSLKI